MGEGRGTLVIRLVHVEFVCVLTMKHANDDSRGQLSCPQACHSHGIVNLARNSFPFCSTCLSFAFVVIRLSPLLFLISIIETKRSQNYNL